jgi:hypothetical protein
MVKLFDEHFHASKPSWRRHFAVWIFLLCVCTTKGADIRVRVVVHPGLIQYLGSQSGNPIQTALLRAQQLVCEAYLPPVSSCPIRIVDIDRYDYTIPADIAEREDGDRTFGQAALRDILAGPANPLSGVGQVKTIYVVSDIRSLPNTMICALPPDSLPGDLIGGCTEKSHARIVLAVGQPPFRLGSPNSPNSWIYRTAWKIAHEIGHSLGLDDIRTETRLDPMNYTTEILPIMAFRQPRPLLPTQHWTPAMPARDLRRYETNSIPQAQTGVKK